MWPFNKRKSPEEEEKFIMNLFGKYIGKKIGAIRDGIFSDDIKTSMYISFLFFSKKSIPVFYAQGSENYLILF